MVRFLATYVLCGYLHVLTYLMLQAQPADLPSISVRLLKTFFIDILAPFTTPPNRYHKHNYHNKPSKTDKTRSRHKRHRHQKHHIRKRS